MVGHQLVISLAYCNNNLALQLYFNGSTTCYLEKVMMVPKNLLLRIQGVYVHIGHIGNFTWAFHSYRNFVTMNDLERSNDCHFASFRRFW